MASKMRDDAIAGSENSRRSGALGVSDPESAPRVAIVGRPNVGKSTLFNRLVGRREALVGDRPGVTRDWREGRARLGPARFVAIDTAGLDDAPRDSLEARMFERTGALLDDVDLTLFLLDGRAGVAPPDRRFAQWLRRRGGAATVLVNKAEGGAGEAAWIDAHELGLGAPVAVSAAHGEGLGELYEAMTTACPALAASEAPPARPGDALRLAIVGRPNVGKSTLVNRLLGEARVVTGPEPGITRDAVTVAWRWRGREILLVDTAGLRRRARIGDAIEKDAAGATARAIGMCEVAVLLVDAAAPLERQDIAIARQIADEGRAMAVAANKWDLAAPAGAVRRRIAERLESALPQSRGAPLACVSARTGHGVGALMRAVFDARDVWSRRLPTAKLNRWLAAMLERHPPPLDGGRRVAIRYIAQVSARPPSFALFVNRADGLPTAYRRYLTNGLRESFDLPGVPIRLLARVGRNPYARARRAPP